MSHALLAHRGQHSLAFGMFAAAKMPRLSPELGVGPASSAILLSTVDLSQLSVGGLETRLFWG